MEKFNTILKIDKLSKYYSGVKAVDEVSFEIEKGEVFGFLGPNGAGKTTTIRCILNFINKTSGAISLFGIDSREGNFHLTRAKVGYLISGNNLNESWTGYDHISYYEGLNGKSKIVKDLIKTFSLNPSAKVRSLSTGNRQKLGLILALMNEPEFLILDEPTNGLDPILQEEFYKILSRLSSNGSTVLMSSHNLPEVEKVCTKVAMIRSGKIITVKNISELARQKIFTVRVTFKKLVAKTELLSSSVAIKDSLPDGYVLSIKGDIDSFIKKIAKFEIASITVSQANLEEIFLEFYK